MSAENLPVLIAGAGPTGLTLACELARRGIGLRIIDKAPAPSRLSRALAVHARTLEHLNNLGVAEDLISRGVHAREMHIHAGGERIVRLGFEELESRYQFVLSVPQAETEAVLACQLKKHGIAVERGAELLDFEQNLELVEAKVRHADGREETIRSRWLVGCDGAHSAVRKAAGFEFPGHGAEETFGLADVRLDWDFPSNTLHAFFSEEGPCAAIPLPGENRWRLIAVLEAAPEGMEAPTAEFFQKILAERGQVEAEASDPAWTAWFRVNYRLSSRYRDNRVFLAGDAAHIHSPVGGVGMNTGIQDAINLAWKLALVERGHGLLNLLDSYETERRPVAEAVLHGTEAATRAITLRSPLARGVRNRLAHFLSSLDIIQRRLAGNVSGIAGVHYRESPLVCEHQNSVLQARLGWSSGGESANLADWRRFHAAPHAGDRAPDGEVSVRGNGEAMVRLSELLRDGRHALLLFDGEAETQEGYRQLGDIGRAVRARWGEFISVHVIVPRAASPETDADVDWAGSLLYDPEGDLEHRYGAGAQCLYLIRPDGYIGFRSQPVNGDALFKHLEHLLR